MADLQQNPALLARPTTLGLIEPDQVGRAVVELGRPRALVRGHGLSVLERAAGLEVGGDACRAERMTADFGRDRMVSRKIFRVGLLYLLPGNEPVGLVLTFGAGRGDHWCRVSQTLNAGASRI